MAFKPDLELLPHVHVLDLDKTGYVHKTTSSDCAEKYAAISRVLSRIFSSHCCAIFTCNMCCKDHSFIFVFGKQTDNEALLQLLHLLTTPTTGVKGYVFK